MARSVSLSEFLGLNNVLSPENTLLRENFKKVGYYLPTATNIDIDNSRKIKRRGGYALKYSGNVHSLWCEKNMCLFREGYDLKRLNTDLISASALRTGIRGSLNMAYLMVDNKVYYSDGNITGVIEGGVSRSWGLKNPSAPVITSTWGTLNDGVYQVCCTYIRSDGQESGASDSSLITLSDDSSGFSIAAVASSDSTVKKIRVYITRRNSSIFYLAYTLDNENQAVYYRNEDGITAIPLKTQNLSAPPAGQILEYYNGMILIGSFDCCWYTEPFKYELCDMTKNFNQFENDLTLIGAVAEGVFFGTDYAIEFARGNTPASMKMEEKADYGAIFGTMRKVKRADIGTNENTETILMFASKEGVCIGEANGNLINVTRGVYDYDSAESGAGFVRREDGVDQFLFTLGDTVTPVSAGAGTSYVQMDEGGTLTSSDNGKVIIVDSSSDQILYIEGALSAVTWFDIIKAGSGKLTIQMPTGYTIDDGTEGGTIYCESTDKAELIIKYIGDGKWVSSGTNTWVTT